MRALSDVVVVVEEEKGCPVRKVCMSHATPVAHMRSSSEASLGLVAPGDVHGPFAEATPSTPSTTTTTATTSQEMQYGMKRRGWRQLRVYKPAFIRSTSTLLQQSLQTTFKYFRRRCSINPRHYDDHSPGDCIRCVPIGDHS